MSNNDWNESQSAELKYLSAEKGPMRWDRTGNEEIRKELYTFLVSEKIGFYKSKWKRHLQRMIITCIKYC